jgi:hypothetical protein
LFPKELPKTVKVRPVENVIATKSNVQVEKTEAVKRKLQESVGAESVRRSWKSGRVVAATKPKSNTSGGFFMDDDELPPAVAQWEKNKGKSKPGHLLGIGEPEDLILGIENGIDTFDCVAPTRIARNGAAYIRGGRINLFNAQFVSDVTPIEKDCGCYTCTNYKVQ